MIVFVGIYPVIYFSLTIGKGSVGFLNLRICQRILLLIMDGYITSLLMKWKFFMVVTEDVTKMVRA